MTLMLSITFAPAPVPQLTSMVATKISYNQLMERLGSWMGKLGIWVQDRIRWQLYYSFIQGKTVMTGNHLNDQRFQAVPYSSILWDAEVVQAEKIHGILDNGKWLGWSGSWKEKYWKVSFSEFWLETWVWTCEYGHKIVDIFVSRVNAHQRSPPWKQH